MEACGTAHHWGRELEALGHTVLLLPQADVRRYRDGDKTDRADTKAILEAARNEAIDSVPVKTIDQQAVTALHRLRSGYLATRTARINCVRGLLREFGVAIPVGARYSGNEEPISAEFPTHPAIDEPSTPRLVPGRGRVRGLQTDHLRTITPRCLPSRGSRTRWKWRSGAISPPEWCHIYCHCWGLVNHVSAVI